MAISRLSRSHLSLGRSSSALHPASLCCVTVVCVRRTAFPHIQATGWSKTIRLIPPCSPPWFVEHSIGLSQWAHGISLVPSDWFRGSPVVTEFKILFNDCETELSLLSIGHDTVARRHSVTTMTLGPRMR